MRDWPRTAPLRRSHSGPERMAGRQPWPATVTRCHSRLNHELRDRRIGVNELSGKRTTCGAPYQQFCVAELPNAAPQRPSIRRISLAKRRSGRLPDVTDGSARLQRTGPSTLARSTDTPARAPAPLSPRSSDLVVADLHDEEPHLFVAAGAGGGKTTTSCRDLPLTRPVVVASRYVSLLSIQEIGRTDRRGSGGRGCLRWASPDQLHRRPDQFRQSACAGC
jgi:hypothetical protein